MGNNAIVTDFELIQFTWRIKNFIDYIFTYMYYIYDFSNIKQNAAEFHIKRFSKKHKEIFNFAIAS